MKSVGRIRSLCLAALLAAACDDAPPIEPGSASEAPLPTPSAAEVDRLRALGYLEFSEARADTSRRGVVVNETARVQPGYNIYNQQHEAVAILMDADGKVLHQFRDPDAKYWARVVLLPDGDLLAVGADERGQQRSEIVEADRFIARMSWDSSLQWKHHIGAHHDVEPVGDGRIITLAMVPRRIEAMDANLDTRDDWIVEFASDGRELRRSSLYDLLAGGPFPFTFGDVRPRLEASAAERVAKGFPPPAERDYVDLLHTNSVERMDLPSLEGASPIHRADSLLVTSRHQDTIAVVSIEKPELRWAWGQGELSGPHDATWLANGNLLVLDNGLGLKRSRVLELEPLFPDEAGGATARIVWQYQDPEPRRFYTASRGSAQRLANGNTLVSNSASGQAFEVTRSGEIVWDFLSPVFTTGGKRATIGRMSRLDAAYVDPLLERFGRKSAN